MRATAFCALAALTILLAGCGNNVRNYWDKVDVTVTESNFASSEDRFARFAELLVKAPEKDAVAGLDALFEKLKADEVSYYVYSEWLVMSFHSLLSPCRNPVLMEHVANRFASDGIMSADECAPILELAAKDKLNLKGDDCILPPFHGSDHMPVFWEPGKETVFLVTNLDCATCVGALRSLADESGEHIALCFGHTPPPSLPGWNYCYSPVLDDVFDLDSAPFWFKVGADGKVTVPYSTVPENNSFASPNL